MKQLLIAGGSHSDVPLILAAKNLGFRVLTTGNQPQDYGHRYSDLYVPCDYSDPEALLAISRQHSLQAIVPCCNDFSALSCAFVAKELGLPGHDNPSTAAVIHHKDRWRSFAQEHHIPGPKAIGCTSEQEAFKAFAALCFPLIIKPVDLTGGKGIKRVDTVSEAVAAAADAFAVSRAGRIVVEEFVEGTRHGFTCILKNQKVTFWFSDDEHYHLSPYLVSGASAPSSLTQETLQSIIGISEQIGKLLNLTDGIFHVQLICRSDAGPSILEICRRPPGDLYVELVRHAAGVPYAEWIVRAFAGLSLDCVSHVAVSSFVTRHCIMADSAGVFQSFQFDESVAKKIREQMTLAQTGDQIVHPESHKLGIAFVHFSSEHELRNTTPDLQKKMRVGLN